MTKFLIPILLLLAGGAARPVLAQDYPRHWLPYINLPDHWLRSENPAGLRAINIQQNSRAGLFFDKQQGGLVNHSDPDNQRAWGATAAAFYRLPSGVAMQGEIIYRNHRARRVGGPAFISPRLLPFNITETEDSLRGPAASEHYSLLGAVAIPLYRSLQAGARVAYNTENLAKHKDPRHKNALLDMTISAGVTARPLPRVTLGLSYAYHRTIESVVRGVYGNTDKQYTYLVDFGAFIGRAELFGDTGYSSSDGPLFDDSRALSAQFELAATNWRLFHEFSFTTRRGYYGEKSTTSICYSNHRSRSLAYSARLATSGARSHVIDLSASTETLHNDENLYRTETTSGSASRVVYLGSVNLLTATDARASISYASRVGLVINHPAWEYSAAADYYSRSRSVSIYPFFREQHLRAFSVALSAAHHRLVAPRASALGFSLSLSYRRGFGAASRDGLRAPLGANQSPPPTLDHLLLRDREYFTIPRVTLDATATRYFSPFSTSVHPYARLRSLLDRSLTPPLHLSSPSSISLALSLGCLF
jgi:hypothetical protein